MNYLYNFALKNWQILLIDFLLPLILISKEWYSKCDVQFPSYKVMFALLITVESWLDTITGNQQSDSLEQNHIATHSFSCRRLLYNDALCRKKNLAHIQPM